jgi:D-proline reductase (dithiol) PrdB
MVRLTDLTESEAQHLLDLPCPENADSPWTDVPSLAEARVAIITSAGLSLRSDDTFRPGASDYRVIPASIDSGEIIMSHVSTNFDRTGFQQDINVVFPIDRLRELAADGVVGSVADFHYSFMGATEPEKMEAKARELAGLLKEDRVNAVLLTPV